MDAKGHAETPVSGVVVKATGCCQSDFEVRSNVSLPRSMQPSNGPPAPPRRRTAAQATVAKTTATPASVSIVNKDHSAWNLFKFIGHNEEEVIKFEVDCNVRIVDISKIPRALGNQCMGVAATRADALSEEGPLAFALGDGSPPYRFHFGSGTDAPLKTPTLDYYGPPFGALGGRHRWCGVWSLWGHGPWTQQRSSRSSTSFSETSQR